MADHVTYLVVVPAVIKGVIMSVLLFALSIDFLDQLVIAAVSATITGAFLLLNTHYMTRETRRNREAITQARDEVTTKIDEQTREQKPPEQ